MNESALNTYHRGDQWIKACGFNEADIIRRLLDEGADVEHEASNPLYRGNFSPLLQACRHGRLDTARLLFKHYTILVRLHAIGTHSTRQGPDRWLLEARTHARRIASFLSPAPTRLALASFPAEPDRRWSCRDLLGDGSRRKLESFYK